MTAEEGVVLLVEDNPDDRFLIQEAWAQAGIAAPLRMVENGQQACAYLLGKEPFADRARFPMPVLVLLDIKMPGKSGLEVLEWMRGREPFKRLPAIVLTASTWPDDVADAYRLGANSFVTKPSSAQDLVDFAAALKSYWLRFNVFPTGA